MKHLFRSLWVVFVILSLSLSTCKEVPETPDPAPKVYASMDQGMVVDGDFLDWTGIPSYKPAGSWATASLKEVKVTADQQYIYVYARMAKALLSGVFSTYFDLDMDAATGYQLWFADCGADVVSQAMIPDRDGGLSIYAGTGKNWQWNRVVKKGLYHWSVPVENGDDAEFELAIDRTLVPGLRNDHVGLVFFLENAQWESKGMIAGADGKPIKLSLTGDREPDVEMITESYQADDAIFANPERGWYVYKAWTDTKGSSMNVSKLKAMRENEGVTQIFMIYHMKGFMDKPLSNEMLELVKSNFKALRDAGLKTVLRFAYTENKTDPVLDAPLDVTLGHINQLAPILKENADIIAVMEAGFIGTYGEWYYSTYYGDSKNQDYAARRQVIQALLNALPKDRMVSVRTPHYKANLLGISMGNPLTEQEAYNGTDKARISHHNDCFLADDTDMGTFKNAESRIYSMADSKYTCMGGETCQLSSFGECVQAIEAMEKYHWSYINQGYHPDVTGGWEQQGCLDDIQRRLGYRFVLKNAEHPVSVSPGGIMDLKLSIENIGFAAPYNPRGCSIILRSESGSVVHQHELNADPRFWFGGSTVEIGEPVRLPAGIPAGTYEVLLSLNDPCPMLSSRPEYAIRLANTGTWEKETGYNKLFRQEVR